MPPPTTNQVGVHVDLNTILSRWGAGKQYIDEAMELANAIVMIASGRLSTVSAILIVLGVVGRLIGFKPGGIPAISGITSAINSVASGLGVITGCTNDIDAILHEMSQSNDNFNASVYNAHDAILAAEPQLTNPNWTPESRDGYYYASGWDTHDVSNGVIDSVQTQVVIDSDQYMRDVNTYVSRLNKSVKDLQKAAKKVAEDSKHCTDSLEDFKDWQKDVDDMLKAYNIIVKIKAAVIATLPFAVIHLSAITDVMDWVKSLIAILQEIEQILVHMVSTARMVVNNAQATLTGFGVPYD